MKIPEYRILDMNKIYEVFCEEQSNIYFNFNERKRNIKKIIKAKYTWLNDLEYNYFYKTIKENEIKIYLSKRKTKIMDEYKDKIVKLFSNIDTNDDNCIDIIELSNILSKLNINHDNIKIIFNKADIDNNGKLDIEEFIDLIVSNDYLFNNIDTILQYKFDIKKNNDKRNILFKNFPGSPSFTKTNWRPSLSELRSQNIIKKYI